MPVAIRTLVDNQHVLLDKEDTHLLADVDAWTVRKDGYVRERTGNQTPLHRQVLVKILGFAIPEELRADHVNGNRLDNTRANLRLATVAQNAHNRAKTKKKCASIYKGVAYEKSNCNWKAHITVEHKRYHIGVYATELEAAKAYNEAAAALFGEFARLNIFETN